MVFIRIKAQFIKNTWQKWAGLKRDNFTLLGILTPFSVINRATKQKE